MCLIRIPIRSGSCKWQVASSKSHPCNFQVETMHLIDFKCRRQIEEKESWLSARSFPLSRCCQANTLAHPGPCQNPPRTIPAPDQASYENVCLPFELWLWLWLSTKLLCVELNLIRRGHNNLKGQQSTWYLDFIEFHLQASRAGAAPVPALFIK